MKPRKQRKAGQDRERTGKGPGKERTGPMTTQQIIRAINAAKNRAAQEVARMEATIQELKQDLAANRAGWSGGGTARQEE